MTASKLNLSVFYQEPTKDVLQSTVHVIGWPGSQTKLDLST